MNQQDNFSIITHNLQKSNSETYEELFNLYYMRLQRYAQHFVNNPAAVQDILQDSFISLWEKRETLQLNAIKPLLFTIVRNNCLNFLRKQKTQKQINTQRIKDDEQWERLYLVDFFNDAEQSLLYQEFQEQVQQILKQLPQRSQQIFKMSRFEELKNKEIAERLGISVKIVERHISRALKLLRKHFLLLYFLNFMV